MAVTLAELAKELNVSPATVSRALTRPELVAAATCERILNHVNQSGYRTNAIARSLRKGRTQTVGVVVADLQNPFYSALVKSIEHTLSRRGFSCVVCDADESQTKEQTSLRLLAELQVSGIIHAFSGSNLQALRQLGLGGIPIVEVDRASGTEGADTVLLNNAAGSELAVNHLIALGHQRVAFISGPRHLTTGAERLRGYQSAMRQAGLDGTALIEFGDFREHSGYLAARNLMSRDHPPTAMIVANNEMMAGALLALHEGGYVLPHDVSLVSFDDVRWARYVRPALTVVAQPVASMGAAAAALMLERLDGRDQPSAQLFAPALIQRESSAPPTVAQSGQSAPSGGEFT